MRIHSSEIFTVTSGLHRSKAEAVVTCEDVLNSKINEKVDRFNREELVTLRPKITSVHLDRESDGETHEVILVAGVTFYEPDFKG